MALADPDMPPGIALPGLSPEPPFGLNSGRYRWLREAFYELPRRSRVVIALRLPIPGRKPLALRATGVRLGVGPERVRQLENQAIWRLSRHPNDAEGELALELAAQPVSASG
jgi:Sigma-70, region 4